MKAWTKAFPDLDESQQKTMGTSLPYFYNMRTAQQQGWQAALEWALSFEKQGLDAGVYDEIRHELDKP